MLIVVEFPWGRIFFIIITLCITLGKDFLSNIHRYLWMLIDLRIPLGAGISSFLNCANAQYDTETNQESEVAGTYYVLRT